MSRSERTNRDAKSAEAAARLTAQVEDRDDSVRVVLSGDLDLATTGIVEEALEDLPGNGKPLVLDLRKLVFLDSSGLRLILTSVVSADEQGRQAFVVRGPAQVNRVFELTGAGERLNLIDDPSLIAKG